VNKSICISCSRQLDNVLDLGLQPVGGLAFSSHGHYGTSVFDPMDGSCIEFAICDDCVVKAGKKGLIILHKPGADKPEVWKPHAASNV